MSDEPFYSPKFTLPSPRAPRPLEPVWSLTKDDRTKTCGMYFHGESYGWMLELSNGSRGASTRPSRVAMSTASSGYSRR